MKLFQIAFGVLLFIAADASANTCNLAKYFVRKNYVPPVGHLETQLKEEGYSEIPAVLRIGATVIARYQGDETHPKAVDLRHWGYYDSRTKHIFLGDGSARQVEAADGTRRTLSVDEVLDEWEKAHLASGGIIRSTWKKFDPLTGALVNQNGRKALCGAY